MLKIFDYTDTELRTAACGAIAGCVSFLVGGFDAPIQALLVLIVVDYVTGMLAAWKTQTLGSQAAWRGIGKKAAMLGVVAFLHMLDVTLNQGSALRCAAVGGYAIMEAMSILENIDRMGYGDLIPAVVRGRLVQIRDQRGHNNAQSNTSGTKKTGFSGQE